MGLENRIKRLESRPEAKRCPEWRLPPGDSGYIIVYEDRGESRKQEWCQNCGRPMYFVIRVRYDDDEGEATASETTVDLSWP